MGIFASVALLAAGLSALTSQAYDLHIKTLTPIKEQAKPAGGDMVFVKDGKLNFAVVIDAQAETRVKSHSRRTAGRASSSCRSRSSGRLPRRRSMTTGTSTSSSTRRANRRTTSARRSRCASTRTSRCSASCVSTDGRNRAKTRGRRGGGLRAVDWERPNSVQYQ